MTKKVERALVRGNIGTDVAVALYKMCQGYAGAWYTVLKRPQAPEVQTLLLEMVGRDILLEAFTSWHTSNSQLWYLTAANLVGLLDDLWLTDANYRLAYALHLGKSPVLAQWIQTQSDSRLLELAQRQFFWAPLILSHVPAERAKKLQPQLLAFVAPPGTKLRYAQAHFFANKYPQLTEFVQQVDAHTS